MSGLNSQIYNLDMSTMSGLNSQIRTKDEIKFEGTVENTSRSLNKIETGVDTVKKLLEHMSEKIVEVKNTMDRVIDMKK